MLSEFFQLGAVPANELIGTYNIRLIILSYLVATMASYIALDMAGRLRDASNTELGSLLWLGGGAIAMGAGIWSMHFIGMLAFSLPMPMGYNPYWTALSLVVAIFASGFALFILKSKVITLTKFIFGGIILGLAIACMHYIGMAAMTGDMGIRYLPGLFFLSIAIAIVASEVALWLALTSNQGTLKTRIRMKVVSAIVMGAAICGMHFTGMAAAVFTPQVCLTPTSLVNPEYLSVIIAVVTLFILGVAFTLSTYKEMLNTQMVKMARQAGMAEVAASVLHNIGNVLNSVNISATLVAERVEQSKLAGLVEVTALLDKHQDDLGQFVQSDPSGTKLPTYLKKLAEYWQRERVMVSDELHKLVNNIQHIKEVIAMQQTLSGKSSFEEIAEVEHVFEESVSIINLDFHRHNIVVKKDFADLKPVLIDRSKLIQILINLVRNAKESLKASNADHKQIDLRIAKKGNDEFMIQVEDNGVGIAPEHLNKIFLHGFTTKKEGHGFGLHASALAAKEMGGGLTVYSAGVGKGAIFTLVLPYKLPRV